MESKIVLQELVSAIKQSTNHPELWDKGLRKSIRDAENLLDNDFSTKSEIDQIIEELYDEVPEQTNDADWWPDELTRAMKKAKNIVE